MKPHTNKPAHVPPQDLEAEITCLGAMLVDNRIIALSIDIIKPDDFYKEAHQTVYSALCKLFEQNHPADTLTVSDELRRNGAFDRIGGFDFLAHCTNMVLSTHNAEHYLHIVREKAELRNLIATCAEITNHAFQASDDIDTILSDAEARIFTIRNRRIAGKDSTLLTIDKAIHHTIDEIERPLVNQWSYTGVPSGFYDLDDITNGFQSTDLIVVAARPGMGKTSFALNVAEYCSINQLRVVFFSLEMGYKQLCQRMLCSMAGINMKMVRSGKISKPENESQLHDLIAKADDLSDSKLLIDDKASPTVPEMLAKCRMIESQYGKIDIIMVDYLQLIPPASNRGADSRNYQIAEVVRSLKQIAKDLELPVIAVAQLNRALENRRDKRPQLSDLRDSGEIEAAADLVLFVHRDDYYRHDEEEQDFQGGEQESAIPKLDEGMAEIIVAKHRNGELGACKLRFKKELTRFENPAFEYQDKMATDHSPSNQSVNYSEMDSQPF